MLMQLHSTFLWYLNVSDAQYRYDTFEQSYTKVPLLFIALTSGWLLMYPYV